MPDEPSRNGDGTPSEGSGPAQPRHARATKSSGERPARPVRREPEPQLARVALDDRGSALAALVSSTFGDEVEIGTELDEVSVRVASDRVVEVCTRMKNHPPLGFDYLRCLSIVDYVERLEVNYHLFSYAHRHKLVVKADLPPVDPQIPSVAGVWRAANWFEREAKDLFGVHFIQHPDLSPLLLYEGFEGSPGLKSHPFHDYSEW